MSTSLLNRSSVRKAFTLALSQAKNELMIPQIAYVTPGLTDQDVFGIIGRPSKLTRKTTTGVPSGHPVVQRVTLNNDEYESAETIRIRDMRHDQTGLLMDRVSQMAVNASNVRWELLCSTIRANTATGYDGKVLYATDHAFGSSGTQKNVVTNADIPALDVSNATNPSPEQSAEAIMNTLSYFNGYKDWRGEPLWEGVTDFVILCAMNLGGPFATAVAANNLAGGESNVFSTLGVRVTVKVEPRLFSTATSSDFYAFALDQSSARSLILADDVAPGVDFLGEDSEYATENNAVKVIGRWAGGVCVGEPLATIKATLS
jgi:hypothetical protein